MPSQTPNSSSAASDTSSAPLLGDSLRCGFVALVGQPNVGKSTLLNALLGTKLSITTHKPQTTRNHVRGVLTLDDRAQIVFVDTPGIHEFEGKKLNKLMVDAALRALGDADVVLMIVDARHALDKEGNFYKEEIFIIEQLVAAHAKTILAVNKVDLLDNRDALFPILEAYQSAYTFESIIPISALKNKQLDHLLDEVVKTLPMGPMLYPADMLTDQAERFFAAEIIREQVTLMTHKEIPYSVAVEIESFHEEPDSNLLRLHAVIHVERDSQKGIVIGKGGSKLKAIGTKSRKALEEFFGKKVFLKTFVHVQDGWTQDARSLDRFGYNQK